MATDESELRNHLIAQTTINVPKSFLIEIQDRFPRAYADLFAQAKSDQATLTEHKIAKLVQDRCFRMDWELNQAAQRHGLAATAKPLPENTWHYTYVSSGSFGLTQSYVPQLGSLPTPAKFRENLASASQMPKLPLDEPSEIYQVKQCYALLAHNPVGQKFDDASQKLGGLQLCIPHHDMKGWALEISVAELLSHYAMEPKRSSRTTAPTWKPQAKPDTQRDKGEG